MEFLYANNQLIDIYYVTLGQEQIELPQPVYQGDLNIEETGDRVIVKGNGFEIPFCKETGLICNAKAGAQVMIEKGPFLNMDVNTRHLTGTRDRSSKYISFDGDWKKTDFDCRKNDGFVLVNIAGAYGNININIQVNISPEGKIIFDYSTSNEPDGYLRESGLKFYIPDAIEHLQWKRKGYWSYYPENDFAGNEGEASFYTGVQAPYGKQPVQAWQYDSHNYFYWGDRGAGNSKPLTQRAKGMKENVYVYTLSTKDKHGFSVISADASIACRTNRTANGQLVLYANNRWDYPELSWGNHCYAIDNNPCYGKLTIVLK
jgi:hypothetical protein